MEILWKWWRFHYVLLLCQLCNGTPIYLEDTVSDENTQLITGLIGVLLIICSLVFLAGCLCCQRRGSFKEFRNSPVDASIPSELDHGHINPIANGEFTIFTPLSPTLFNNNVFLPREQIITSSLQSYIHDGTDLSDWFNVTEKEFPRIKLKYIKELGRGKFGKVVQGAAQDIGGNEEWTPVVVRILDSTSSHEEKLLFLKDALIYRIGTHPNLLSLYGRCLDTVPFLLLQEYCQEDLKTYLRSTLNDGKNNLPTEYPLFWSSQLTSALKHLHSNNITHSDLACRNCQLTANLTLKLGDYSLSMNKYPSDYYRGLSVLPIRWCAPESITFEDSTIRPKKLTPKNNIWSLGVTMWEICQYGEQPYSELNDEHVILQVLRSNHRLQTPTHTTSYTDYIYRVMQLCWTEVESRPKITEIDLVLADLLQIHGNSTIPSSDSCSFSSDDFDKKWELFKPNSIVKTDHISDSISIEMNDSDIKVTKPLSPSLYNLHGSLDNLLLEKCEPQLEFSFEGENGLEKVICSSDSSDQESISRGKPNLDIMENNDFSNIFFQRTSSGSDTEDEHWRNKVERGAYTEKVRMKSRSVADLMILTHVDYSESESETPLPSLDYRVNYKNVRNNNLESVGHTFGSEGNLLSIQDTFQEELKKLQEERRDSLLFVPDNSSKSSCNRQCSLIKDSELRESNLNNLTSSAKLLCDLNSPEEIRPNTQVFNVYNVTVDNYPPICENQKLNELINFKNYFQLETDSNAKHVTDIRLNEQFIPAEIISPPADDVSCDNKICDSNLESVVDTTGHGEIDSQTDLVRCENDPDENCESNETKLKIKFKTNDTILDLEGLPLIETQISENDNIRRLTLENKRYDCTEKFDLDLVPNQNESQPNTKMDCTEKIDLDLVPNQNESQSNTKMDCTEKFDLGLVPNQNESQPNTKMDCDKSKVETHQSTKSAGVNFDLSIHQEEAMANSLTHSNAFTSTPLKIRKMPLLSSEDMFSSINSFNIPIENNKIDELHSSNVLFPKNIEADNENLTFSLETWDNFLDKTLDCQNDSESLFDSFSSEPKSLLFIEHGDNVNLITEGTSNVEENRSFEFDKEVMGDEQPYDGNCTFILEPGTDKTDETFVVEGSDIEDVKNVTFTIDKSDLLEVSPEVLDSDESSWENNEGWFLHPQTNEELSGEMQISSSNSASYVGFGIDDEIMSAIRNELLSKLPHAQGSHTDRMKDETEWDSAETNEVFLRYNVYNTPLSPIPEESYTEETSGSNTPKQVIEDDDSDWSDRCEVPQDTDSHSARTLEGLFKGPLHRHTPSEDSCCSNDTLFNLEELNFAALEVEKEDEYPITLIDIEGEATLKPNTEVTDEHKQDNDSIKEALDTSETKEMVTKQSTSDSTFPNIQQYLNEFLLHEREYVSNILGTELKVESKESQNSEGDIHNINKQIPENTFSLFFETRASSSPSPDNKPSSQLPISILSCEKITPQSSGSFETENNVPEYANVPNDSTDDNFCEHTPIVDEHKNVNNNEPDYANCDEKYAQKIYDDVSDDYNNYVNLVNIENAKNTLEYNSSGINNDCINIENPDKDINSDDDNIFGMLTDIRFSGPTDSQLMSTSFSESNNCDEQEWDSGSDSRSSSSGEFIWKEGEHEESLKALRAAPHDVLEDITPMEKIAEDQFEESDISSSFTDEEGETPEFIPSAWDKFAIPSKSALRSPEKTLNRNGDKKAKVWFKKQKYHCIYEYPKEPESPVLQSQDLWKPQTDYQSYADWEFDGETYCPLPSDEADTVSTLEFKPKIASDNRSIYQLTDISDFIPGNTGLDEEFFISSSSQPFDVVSSSSSQFFPGNSNWLVENSTSDTGENATPDSGVEDMTPGSLSDNNYAKIINSFPTLKQLASECINKNKQIHINNEDMLGGLRHTRNKLKLDLPSSPSAFTTEKMFTIETNLEPVIREKPTFTTFGKSRFFVQQIDAPPDESSNRNVSFEALPYKPIITECKKETDVNLSNVAIKKNCIKDENSDIVKLNIEIVRGEASLLDSADEDSGIESSTLERKLSNI